MNQNQSLQNIVRRFKMHKRGLAALLIVVLVVTVTQNGLIMGVLNPGFEGAKAYFYGSYFPGSAWPGYTGANVLHKYQEAEDPLIKETHNEGLGRIDQTSYWTTLADPSNPGLDWTWKKTYASGQTESWSKPELKVHIESNLQIQDIDKQGDPLNWNASDPMDARRVEYWSKKAVKVSETNDSATQQTVITYQYELTKESFILAPVEFWVGYYLVPSQTDTMSATGWREGEYNSILMWFRLDFNTWDNAYKDAWLDDPKQNVFTSEFNGTILNQEKINDYRGGFPIAGWVQGWEKAGISKTLTEEEGPVWANRRGAHGDAYYTADQLADIKNKLLSKCQISPGMIGSFISLYNEPNVNFQYKSDLTEQDFNNIKGVTDDVKTPDSTMYKVMYFPMTIENFGTLTEVAGSVVGVPTAWDVYYPEAYFRMRMIYGVYGTFKYLWTEQVTLPWKIVDPVTGEVTYPGGLDYPSEFERQGTVIIHAAGPAAWTVGITDWFANPFNLFYSFLVIMVVLVLVVTVLNPGLWGSLALVYKSTKGKPRAK